MSDQQKEPQQFSSLYRSCGEWLKPVEMKSGVVLVSERGKRMMQERASREAKLFRPI